MSPSITLLTLTVVPGVGLGVGESGGLGVALGLGEGDRLGEAEGEGDDDDGGEVDVAGEDAGVLRVGSGAFVAVVAGLAVVAVSAALLGAESRSRQLPMSPRITRAITIRVRQPQQEPQPRAFFFWRQAVGGWPVLLDTGGCCLLSQHAKLIAFGVYQDCPA